MRRQLLSLVSLAVLGFSLAAFAVKTAEQLKIELQGILPAGKKARLVWLKGGFQRGDWTGAGDKQASLYVMDSDDGIVRELTPASLFPGGVRDINRGDGGNPNITFDGSRVIFKENLSGEVYWINFNGNGGLHSINLGTAYLSRYWRDPIANTDWVTVDENSSAIYKINIDDPSKKVLLWNKSGLGRPWYSLSTDGTRMAFNCPHPAFGIATVPNGTLTTIPGEGCFINISPDNNYQVMPQNGNHTVHTIYTSSGSVVKSVQTSNTILAGYPNPTKVTLNGCNNGEMEYETTRWVHPDYLTFFFYATNVNPFIECISTGKWMYIHDAAELGLCGWAGNMDMVILNPSGVSRDLKPASSDGLRAEMLRGNVYSLDGRRMNPVELNNGLREGSRGLAIRSTGHRARVLLMP